MLQVGVDVGGTFTDLFAWDADAPEAGRVRQAKVLSTPEDPSIGFMEAIEVAGIDAAEISTVVHGTTIATNALIERRYPEPALVTTQGFRDVLEIGRQRRKPLYDPYQFKTPPLIARSRRFTVPEKLGADGSTVIPLDRDEARRVAERIAELGITNIAVAFINAYQDGRHEREMRDALLEVIPDAQIALSSETRPKMRELGRFVTTAIRASLLPVVGDYLERLQDKLRAAGCTAPLYIVKSNGGMMSASTARERPEEMIESGPAGGVAAGSYLSSLMRRLEPDHHRRRRDELRGQPARGRRRPGHRRVRDRVGAPGDHADARHPLDRRRRRLDRLDRRRRLAARRPEERGRRPGPRVLRARRRRSRR